MSPCLMLSINPPHSRNILEGIKRVEWRKYPLRICKRAFLYETKNCGGCGMVVGEIFFGAVRSHNIFAQSSLLLEEDLRLGCVPLDELKRYAGNRGTLFAHEVANVVRFRRPILLSEFGLSRPPLSWCYCFDPFEFPDLPDWDRLLKIRSGAGLRFSAKGAQIILAERAPTVGAKEK